MLADLFRTEVTEGRIYDLGQPYHSAMPHWPGAPGFGFTPVVMHPPPASPDSYSACVETCAFSTHLGTHMDALGHVAVGGKVHGGMPASQTKSAGLARKGIDETGPVVTRGVLLDIAGLKSVDVLAAGYEITPADLEDAEKATNTKVKAGDAVFIRTGWSRYFSQPERFHGPAAPGPGPAAARWLASRSIRATGSETPAYEKCPNSNFPAHVVLLFENGITIIEWMNLEPLAQAGITTFVAVVIPLKIVGASGSPVRPIAIK